MADVYAEEVIDVGEKEMNLVLSDCLSALKKVLSNNHVSPDYVEKYTQEFMNMLGKQYYEQVQGEKMNLTHFLNR